MSRVFMKIAPSPWKMLISFVLTCCLGLHLIASARPTFQKSYYDHHLGSPVQKRDGSFSLNNRVTFDDDTFIEMSYDAMLHGKGTYLLDDIASVDKVECHPGKMLVHFLTEEDAAAFAETWSTGDVLTGGREWNCLDEAPNQKGHHLPVHLLRKVRSINRQGTTLHIDTGNRIRHEDVFKNLDLRFRTNAFPSDLLPPIHPSKHLKKATFSNSSSFGERGSSPPSNLDFNEQIFNGNALKESASDLLGDVGEFFGSLIDLLKSGQVDWDFSPINGLDFEAKALDRIIDGALAEKTGLQFNYDGGGRRKEEIVIAEAGDGSSTLLGLRCSNCYYFIVPVIDVQLSIQNNKLQLARILIEGTIRAEIEISFDFETQQYFSGSKTFLNRDKIQLPTLRFLIAGTVPVIIEPFMEADITFDALNKIEASARAGYSVNAFIQFGLVYRGDTNQLEYIGEAKFYPPEAAFGVASAGVESDIIVSVIPRLLFRIDFIGGPYLSLRPYIQTIAQSSDQYCLTEFDEEYLFKGALNFGLQLALGAFLDIESPEITVLGIDLPQIQIYETMWDPVTLYQLHEPISHGCMDFSSGFVDFIGSPLLRGTTWSGIEDVSVVVNNTGQVCDLWSGADTDVLYIGSTRCAYIPSTSTCEPLSATQLAHCSNFNGDETACNDAAFDTFVVSITYQTNPLVPEDPPIDCQATMLYTMPEGETPQANGNVTLDFDSFLTPENGAYEAFVQDPNGGSPAANKLVLCHGFNRSSIPTVDFKGQFLDTFNNLELEATIAECLELPLVGRFGELTNKLFDSAGSKLTSAWTAWLFA